METSFRVPEIVGILQIRPRLRDLSAADRLVRARMCVEFAKKWKTVFHASRLQRTSATFTRSRSSGQPPRAASHSTNIHLMESMVPLDHFSNLVESYSTLARQEAVVTVNVSEVSVQLINSQTVALTQHMVSWLAVLWLSPENELVYIGREQQSGLRIAVVLQMASQEDGLHFLGINAPRVKQKPVHQLMKNPGDEDAFYVNIGCWSEDKEKLDRRFSNASSTHADKNTDLDTLQKHLIYFIKDEIKYCTVLSNLIRLRNGLKDVQLNHELRRWDLILKVHEDMNLKKFVSIRNLTARSVSETLLGNSEKLECYIEYIRETPSIESSLIRQFKDYQEIRENVFSTRKRIFNYFSNLESWLEFTTNGEEEEESIKKAIVMLKNICKTADSLLIVDSIKKCPFSLSRYLPLLKHGKFTVVGKNFKKDAIYKLLLFEDILVFTESSLDYLNCFEVFRFEQVVLMSVKERQGINHAIKLEINHGPRRGKEIIWVVGKKEDLVKQWEEDIRNILAQLAQRIN